MFAHSIVVLNVYMNYILCIHFANRYFYSIFSRLSHVDMKVDLGSLILIAVSNSTVCINHSLFNSLTLRGTVRLFFWTSPLDLPLGALWYLQIG